MFGYFIFFCVFVNEGISLKNGLALTPPMGWMSWGYYACAVNCTQQPDKCLNEALIMSVTDAFFEEGYQEAGYEYIIIDDCWSEHERGKDGRLVADRKRFPRGMKFLADYIHKKGLKFGMYTNIADVTCMMYPGSKSHFGLDAETFASWDIDYLKVDGCFVEEQELNVAYKELGKALNKTGRPILYSCSWPYYIEFIVKHEPNLSAVAQHCNMWRNYHDVFLNWPSVQYIIRYYEKAYPKLVQYHKPGQWNDPDMLVFGTGALSVNQLRVQLVVYAMLSAPLLLSCDMRRLQPDEKSLLLNMDLIAIAQDPRGIMAKPHRLTDAVILFVKSHLPMKGNRYLSFSFAVVNMGRRDERVSFRPFDYDLDTGDLHGTNYTLLDVLKGVYMANITLAKSISVNVAAEDVILFSLYPL